MRQYEAALALALVACGSSSSPNAPVDGAPLACTNPPPGPSVCGMTCGNGVVDTCYVRGGESCAWTAITEVCDGNATSCASLGYLGDGNATCTGTCHWDLGACLGCEVTSTVLECDALAKPGMLAASGDQLAFVADSATRYGHDGNGALIQLGSSGVGLQAAVAMPSGWIVIGPDGGLAALDKSGVLGPFSGGNNEPHATYAFAASTDRMIEVWEAQIGNQSAVTYRIADASGAIVVQTLRLGTETITRPVGATSDGSSFFVLALGQITRIAADGSVLSASPYPANVYQVGAFAWGTTGGWFTGSIVDNADFAQRFDQTGALIGSRMTLADRPVGFSVDGDDLLEGVGSGTLPTLRLDRITPAGGVTQSPELGVGFGISAVRFGPDLVAEWNKSGTGIGTDAYLARIAF